MTDHREESDSETFDAKPKEMSDAVFFRLLGLGAIVIGLIILACFVGWPIYQAHNGVRGIRAYRNLFGVGIVFVQGGLNSVIFGKSVLTWIPSGDTKLSDISFSTWLVLISNLVVGVYALGIIEKYLTKIGCVVSR